MLDTIPVEAFLDPHHLELAAGVAGFVDAEIVPLGEATDDESARVMARSICARLGAGGWLAPIGAQDFRGCCLVRERLAHASPLADAVFALQGLGCTPLALAGSGEQRERWLEPALRGDAVAAFAMTEPAAGSDVASLRTTAAREGDGYILNGEKTLISNAGIADFYLTFAVTDPEAGTRGISAFVVPADAPGFRFVKAQVMAEPHPLGVIRFEDCRVGAESVVGEEGRGFGLGLATLDRLRPTVGAAACGIAARALEEALGHAVERVQFGRALADFGITQEKLGWMATDLTAARLLVYRAAWMRDRGAERTDAESAMAKAFATETAQRVVDGAVQILGGRGVLAEHAVDRLYRAVRALRIYEGTTEIQRLIIANHLIRKARGAAESARGSAE